MKQIIDFNLCIGWLLNHYNINGIRKKELSIFLKSI